MLFLRYGPKMFVAGRAQKDPRIRTLRRGRTRQDLINLVSLIMWPMPALSCVELRTTRRIPRMRFT
ncbi:hypothetical protein CEJ86_32335 [Sinorhizobium meliloti]|uniref:Uncharacterized protein n=1 Tax=Rhizobium meliloti TaxID=382 RepID=A0A2J0YT20_RHIML|nr:hypothetical protein CEJ86_32335 [Sinorhizobium meliloti]